MVGRGSVGSGEDFRALEAAGDEHFFIKSIHGAFAFITIVTTLPYKLIITSLRLFRGWHKFCRLYPCPNE